MSAVLRLWKDIIKRNTDNSDNLLTYSHHIKRGPKFLTVGKLKFRELYPYLMLIILIIMLPRKAAYSTYLRPFQYRILNNILFLNNFFFYLKRSNF